MNTHQMIGRRFLLLTCIVAVLFATVGCTKPADAAAPTMQMDMAQMLQTASQATDGGDAQGGAQSAAASMRARVGAPAHVSDSFQDKSGRQTVEIDADVYVPNATKLSIVEVQRAKLTQDMADRAVNALVQGQLMAYDTSLNRCIGRIEVQQWIDALDLLVAEQGASADDAWKAQMQAERAYLLSVLETATEDAAPITARLTHPAWRGRADGGAGYLVEKTDSLQLLGVATSDAGYETLRIWKGTDEGCIMHYVREPNQWVSPGAQIGSYRSESELALAAGADSENPFGEVTLADVPNIPAIATTREQAITTGDDLMQALAIADVACVDAEKCWGGSFDGSASGVRGLPTAAYGVSNPLRCVWRLRYTRTFNGMETTYDTTQCTPFIDPDDDKEVLPAADYESIEVYVDDTGVVGFRWASPLTVGNVAVEDAAVLPFEEIMQVFANTFFAANGYPDPSAEVYYKVTDIRFGYVRIREQSVYDKGMLIPAWSFFGERVYDPDGAQQEIRFRPDASLFTINAIDGAIINLQQGY